VAPSRAGAAGHAQKTFDISTRRKALYTLFLKLLRTLRRRFGSSLFLSHNLGFLLGCIFSSLQGDHPKDHPASQRGCWAGKLHWMHDQRRIWKNEESEELGCIQRGDTERDEWRFGRPIGIHKDQR
jgi:hypothetical protein